MKTFKLEVVLTEDERRALYGYLQSKVASKVSYNDVSLTHILEVLKEQLK